MDYLLIDQRLRDRGPEQYDEIGEGYLQQLSDAEPHSFVSPGLTERLIELARRRRVYLRTVDLTHLILDPSSPFSDVIDYADGLTAHLDADGSDAAILGPIRTTRALFDAAKAPEFLVRNFLTAGSLVVWSAPEKAWKTTLGVMLALVVTGHGKFLGQYEGLKTGSVVFFSGESGDWPLKSMMTRILEWIYPAPIREPSGNSTSWIPNPDSIPIAWAGDPPDLGTRGAVHALKRLIRKHDAKLLILDPSQALFASIGENVKNDFAMRQYMKKLQVLARETGCCVLLLHHFRQSIPPGFPKRSDSSFGGFMKFTDGWILANNREPPTGEEEPGSGQLYLTWGSRDGFGGSLAIDVEEGTEETGRFFDVRVSDVSVAMASQAAARDERKRKKSTAARDVRIRDRKDEILAAMDDGDVAYDRETIARKCNTTSKTLRPLFQEMLKTGEIVQAPRAYRNRGKVFWTDGYCLPERREAVLAAAYRCGHSPETPN